MLTNTKYARKLLDAQDRRRNLTDTEKMLETALLQAALLHRGVGDSRALTVLEAHMDEHRDLFWDYLTYALVTTGDSFGVRPGTWQTRSADELCSILAPITATPEEETRIRSAVSVLSEAIREHEGALSDAMKAQPSGGILLDMAFTISRLAASRAGSDKAAAALIVRGVRRITDRYHAAQADKA